MGSILRRTTCPSAPDALFRLERALLGAAMLDELDCARLLVSLTPDDFGDSRCRIVARAVAFLAKAQKPVTYASVTAYLDTTGAAVSHEYVRGCLRSAFDVIAA